MKRRLYSLECKILCNILLHLYNLKKLFDPLPEVLDGHLDGFHDAIMLISPLLSQLTVPTHKQATLDYYKHNDTLQNCAGILEQSMWARKGIVVRWASTTITSRFLTS
jgi:hypothetical protein